MENKYKKTKNTISLINYHFVFCPRYRRKIFLNEELKLRFGEITEEVCDDLDIQIREIKYGDDYVYLLINSPPILSPADIMQKIKGITSGELRKEFDELNKMPSLWTRNYFVSTAANIPIKTIEKYVEEQKTRY
ncbi:IS200/IS605 family transposase [Priestia megaterium]|uniref:IS200/IS605 family transposase n=1 Tax=Priestia megaterium TaxID=1404 RepID=UPI003CC5DB26